MQAGDVLDGGAVVLPADQADGQVVDLAPADPARTTLPRAQLLRIAAAQRARGAAVDRKTRHNWHNVNSIRKRRQLPRLSLEEFMERRRKFLPQTHDGERGHGFRDQAAAECSEAPANPCPKCGGPLGHTPYLVCWTCARREKRRDAGAIGAAGAYFEPETDL